MGTEDSELFEHGEEIGALRKNKSESDFLERFVGFN